MTEVAVLGIYKNTKSDDLPYANDMQYLRYVVWSKFQIDKGDKVIIILDKSWQENPIAKGIVKIG